MRISKEINEAGMQEKARAFREKGGEIHTPEKANL